jgi:hypothetical protein
MNQKQKNDAEKIITEYNIDVKSTSLVEVKNLKKSTNVFKINRSDLIEELYLIDTISGKNIACHPYIIGNILKKQAHDAALEAAKSMTQLTYLSKIPKDSIVFANILRGAPGYELHPAFKKLNSGKGFHEVWLRLKYEKSSYRSHNGESTLGLNIIYEDFEELPRKKEVVIIKPDTEASGMTGQKSIERLVKKCKEVKSTITEIILYGFISIPALKKINETTKRHGIKLVAFSIENLTELAHNNYDMTLYGIDEGLWRTSKKIRKLGSIVDLKTLERFLPEFIPGSDQPGDWSERQTSVYVTKEKKINVRNDTHLKNSIQLIRNLKKISNFTIWQEQIANQELQYLKTTLQKLNNSIKNQKSAKFRKSKSKTYQPAPKQSTLRS